MRCCLLLPLALVITTGHTLAHAEGPSVTAPFGIYGDLEISLQVTDGSGWQPMTETQFASWWGAARCACQAEEQLRVVLRAPGAPADSSKPVELWVGPNCNEPTPSASCGETPLVTTELSELSTGVALELEAAQIIAPPDSSCQPDQHLLQTLWVLLDDTEDGLTDTAAALTDIPTDTRPPPSPETLTLAGGEARLQLNWTSSATAAAEVIGYQALCSVANAVAPAEEQPLSASSLSPAYATPTLLCAAEPSAPGSGTPLDAPEPPAEYLCGEIAAPATELSISLANSSLADGAQVRVRLISLDAAGNYTVSTPTPDLAGPQPSVDFWEHYDDAGGQAISGCNTTSSHESSRAALVLLLLVVGASLRGKRRRLAALTTCVGLLAIGLGPAYAQSRYSLGGDETVFQDDDAVPNSTWTVELKFGPYTPNIDDEPGLADTRPFETMFGKSSQRMWELESTRHLARPAGQLGLALSVGNMGATAKACLPTQPGEAPCAKRSEVDETAFSLIPLSVQLVYRLTKIADNTSIPLIPYLKLGLGAYSWRITTTDGNVATSDRGNGSGWSYGYRGSAGLAIRLDGLEPSSARNLQELGVEHTSLFVEATAVRMPGWGSTKRMHVGDTTWAIGFSVDF